MVESSSPAELRLALEQLLKARALLLAAAGKPWTADGEVSSTGGASAVQQALEKLHPLKRGLEEVLEIAEAGQHGEDHHVEVVLRQREVALQQRADADQRLREEQEALADVRRDLGELERACGRDRRRRERVEGAPREERTQALRHRATASRETLAELRSEMQAMSHLLGDVKVKNHAQDARAKQLEDGHRQAVAINHRAKEALGDEINLAGYKIKKAAECADADSTFSRAKAAYEAFMDGLAEDWQEKQAAYLAGIEDLEDEVQRLRICLAEERATAKIMLSSQASTRKMAIREVHGYVASELGHLESQRQQRHTSLRREVVSTRQQLEDASLRAQKTLDVQLREAKLVYRARLQREEASGEDAIQGELRSVVDAKREREEMEKKASKMKENYRVHAIKSKNYVKSLDKDRRRQLVGLWAKK